ncbi:5'-nucleotidase C-terminal domain-containing protein [Sulfitobacter mediterraneus]|uniref:bifunctional metallophosphatase/5'-nucleotidase n=1 Tax=Sulfitobacter mediterraneus TaxID=83219 RepID=UPI001933EDCF|nr:5'-nucleotidase C-terminal domain-containing protein [Sulfitobacter mediterraneus]MBM1633323.1 5'-nucleotidase C-terminal domain-containing protein [Sulfitobacter mediterraneus]MBM1640543.1 5'-nucleotidase C-terminal domain-containing protein [Sulfitobacter mediterraneus]MBM1645188.1 5'-nucleotidase C-terminal domain-containing protein [Sulfitobacter mediterraneus]MBM1648663.1 5'-nucleotidase C-terminal domain-containing protein [Sulfitobacter mediterraneus]MBM1652684.1 5'-nucleotidase C-te
MGPDDHKGRSVGLRILATTDLHLQLHGYDYHADRQGPHFGLAGLAPQITTAREEAERMGMACVLLDNGDFLQGGAMGTWLANRPVTAAHPLVKTMNTIGYDAIGLGNHDLDFGLPYLNALAEHLNMPLVASNLRGPTTSALYRSAIVSARLPSHGTPPAAALRVGVISVLPRGTDQWNANVLSGQATVQDYHKAVERAAPALRSAGAHVVVLLAHMGRQEFHTGTASDPALASLRGIDAIVLGHTHESFPLSKSACSPNSPAGRIAGRPAIMPGHHGSHLGVLDITLQAGSDNQWRVCAHQAELRENTSRPCEKLLSASAQAHGLVQRHLRQPVGRLQRRMHNYFSFAAPTQICALLAQAKRAAILDQIRGTANAALPLAIAVSAQTAGGRNGADNFVEVAPGPFLRRDLNAPCPHDNEIWALRVTGREIRGWLEQAAAVFQRLQACEPDQNLLHPGTAPFHFLTLYGLRYEIDPTKPLGARISDLRCDQGPLAPKDSVVLVTDHFRAGGGGGYPALDPKNVILRHAANLHAAVQDSLTGNILEEDPLVRPWKLKPSQSVKAILNTSPRARLHLQDIAHLKPEDCGTSEDGFAKIRLSL